VTAWDDLDARVRGLASHLLGAPRLRTLMAVPDLSALARELRDTAYGALLPSEHPAAQDVDRAIRGAAAKRLRVVQRWARGRAAALAVIFEDEDRRSISALVRGVVAGVRPEERVAGLLPTPALPERALAELARQPTAGALAALLVAWGNPYGSAILPLAAHAKPDLLRIEHALDASFAERAGGAARRSAALRAFVEETIDLENIAAALVLAGARTAPEADAVFRAGGRHVTRAAFLRAAAAPGAAAALQQLEADVTDPLWSRVLRGARGPGGVERAALRERVRVWRRRAIAAPLGAAPVLGYVLRLRAEALDLRTIAWAHALGVRIDAAEALVSS
jgi:vacuolar-type H+-ATPase subunit C/Vma6